MGVNEALVVQQRQENTGNVILWENTRAINSDPHFFMYRPRPQFGVHRTTPSII